MDKIIELKSKGETNYLKRLDSTERDLSIYILKTESPLIKTGYTNKGVKFILPVGGPNIIIGEILEEVGKKVKSLEFKIGLGHIITFEE